MLRSNSVSREKVSLGGANAVVWLQQRGFATTTASPEFRLVADAYRAPDLALARILRGPGETKQGGSKSPATSLSAVTQGTLELLLPTGGVVVERGQAFFNLTTCIFGTRNIGSVSTIEVVFESKLSSRFERELRGGPLFVPNKTTGIRAVSSFANEILGSADKSSIPLTIGYRIAIEAIACDLLNEIGCDLPMSISPADRRIITCARKVIQQRLADSKFSIHRLAAELAVSERRLQRAFASIESTAQASLRRARVEAAEKLLRTYAIVTQVDLDFVAQEVGLPGNRALKDHFAAHGQSIPHYFS